MTFTYGCEVTLPTVVIFHFYFYILLERFGRLRLTPATSGSPTGYLRWALPAAFHIGPRLLALRLRTVTGTGRSPWSRGSRSIGVCDSGPYLVRSAAFNIWHGFHICNSSSLLAVQQFLSICGTVTYMKYHAFMFESYCRCSTVGLLAHTTCSSNT